MRKQSYVVAIIAVALIATAALLLHQRALAQILVPMQGGENVLMPVQRHFVKMKVDEKTSILVETIEPIPVMDGNRVEGAPRQAIDDYPTFVGKIKPIVSGIVESVREGAGDPDEINVEIGLSASAGANWALVSLSGQANLKVSVTWRKEKK
jgi:hypothetical protein